MIRVFLSKVPALLACCALLVVPGCGSDSNNLPLAIGAEPGVDGSGAEVPTIDISGHWQGKWFSNNGPANGLLANLTISQSRNDFQGNLEVIGAELIVGTKSVVGTVFGTKFDGDFDSGLAVADCFADIEGKHMDGTYQFRIPFNNEFGTFALKHG
jgi:hypothetical protein